MSAQSLAKIAQLVGEPGRIRMLASLLNSEGRSASELAMAAGVSPQTASSHLAKLESGGLVSCVQHGRQRVFRLKDRDVAIAIEALGALARPVPDADIPEVRFARTCYDHLAGVLAISLRNEFLRRGVLREDRDGFEVTSAGAKALADWEIGVTSLRQLRRGFANRCLDWTERHHHIGGAVGAALLSRFFELRWIARVRGSRAVRVTHMGESGFEKTFGIRYAALRGLSRAERTA